MIIFIKDILYNILLHCDYETVNNITFLVAKNNLITYNASNIYKDDSFWIVKYSIDYPTIKPITHFYQVEYVKVYNSYQKAMELTNIIINMKDIYNDTIGYEELYLPDYIDFTLISDIYKEFLADKNIKIDSLFLKFYVADMELHFAIGCDYDNFKIHSFCNVSKYEFILFTTNILYKYPDFDIKSSYLFSF